MPSNRDSLHKLIAMNLQEVMDETGLNNTTWAAAAGLGRTAVHDIIRMVSRAPTYYTLVRLAEAANVDLRRITVGRDYAQVDEESAEALHLLSQLSAEARQTLLDVARAQVARRGRSPEQPDEGDDSTR